MFKKYVISILFVLHIFTPLGAVQWQASKSLNLALPPAMIDAEFKVEPAKPLLNKTPMESGHRSQAFVGGVGGVSFDKTAIMADSLLLKTWSVLYDSLQSDGKRLVIKLNDREIKAELYDWMLKPIAEYADSDYFSCFTLFGHLKDTDMENAILDEGGRIMNYHPAFENTLLGLRLMHLDLLILYPTSVVLPTNDDGSELLGAGEIPAPPAHTLNALNDFNVYFQAQRTMLGCTHRSWVITDFQRDVSVQIMNDSLVLAGSPYYYFWRHKFDREDYDQNTAQEKIVQSLNEAVSAAEHPADVIFPRLIETLRRYEEDYAPAFQGTVNDILNLETDDERREFLQNFDPHSIQANLLIPMLTYMDAHEVDYLKELSDSVSDKREMLRAINPPVWDAVEKTMHYAALFRFLKIHAAEEWRSFVNSLQNVDVEPAVVTPTIIYPPRQ